MQLSKLLSLVLLGVSAITAQDNNSSIYDLLTAPNNNLDVSTFVDLLSSDPSFQPVIDALKNPGNFTCFVPNNKAIAEAMEDYKEYAEKNRLNTSVNFPPANQTFGNVSVLDVVKYHCINGTVELANLTDYVTIFNTTANSSNIDPVGHGLPIIVSNNASWNEFHNESWMNANRQYLEYEVDGSADADVVKKDIKASNGYLNIIDDVLFPPLDPNATLSDFSDAETFYKVLATHPEVAEYLDGLTNFTLFAPNDRALRGFNYAGLSNDTVKTFVMAHIVNGTLTTVDFPQGESELTNFNNQTFPLFVNGSFIRLNNTAPVRSRNILFNNGIMHVITKALATA